MTSPRACKSLATKTRRVALRYAQLLTRQGDALRLRYALGLRGADSATELRIEIARGDLYGTPYSPTHTIDSRTEGGRLDITVSPGMAGDVELFLPLRRPVAGATLLSHAAGGEDGYFMPLLAPGPAGRAQAVPRDVTLVVDVSGSDLPGRCRPRCQHLPSGPARRRRPWRGGVCPARCERGVGSRRDPE